MRPRSGVDVSDLIAELLKTRKPYPINEIPPSDTLLKMMRGPNPKTHRMPGIKYLTRKQLIQNIWMHVGAYANPVDKESWNQNAREAINLLSISYPDSPFVKTIGLVALSPKRLSKLIEDTRLYAIKTKTTHLDPFKMP
jgi:hypothetical protein